jgi:hypothetical protein
MWLLKQRDAVGKLKQPGGQSNGRFWLAGSDAERVLGR